jgi:hypothetical protein
MLGVVALEELLRSPLDPIELSVREHQMYVWLLLAIARPAVVDRPLVHPRGPELLACEPLHQRDPRRRRQLPRQGELVLAVRISIGALELIRGAPKRRPVLVRPRREIRVAARLDGAVLLFGEATLASNVLAVLGRFAFAAGIDLDVIRGHGLAQGSEHSLLRRGMKTAQQGRAESRIGSDSGAE